MDCAFGVEEFEGRVITEEAFERDDYAIGERSESQGSLDES